MDLFSRAFPDLGAHVTTRSTPRGAPLSLESFAEELHAGGLLDVDSREWSGEWSDRFVAFADLIGFASQCERSPDTVVNWIVRFHRALTWTEEHLPQLQVLRFTDAAYLVADTLQTLLKASAEIQHFCLAANSWRLYNGPRPAQRHYMVIPRITIGKGRILTSPNPLPDESRFSGIDSRGLMAGDGLFSAYSIEKRTAGGMVSLNMVCQTDARQQTVRGSTSRLRSVLERWTTHDDMWQHDGVLDFPWLLMRPIQPEDDGLWVDERANFGAKAEAYREIWNLSIGDYVRDSRPIDVIKHFGGSQRHLSTIVQRVLGHQTLQAWDLARTSEGINQINDPSNRSRKR